MKSAFSEWRPQYNIGIEALDNDHRELFSKLTKLMELVRSADYNARKDECFEAVENIKRSLVTHFSAEETYMQAIGYKGYEIHKYNHDNLLKVTIPELEVDMINSRFAAPEVSVFIAVVTGWCTSHILIDDHAITGKAVSRFTVDKEKDFIHLLTVELNTFMSELSDLHVEMLEKHYDGTPLNKGFYYEIAYEDGTEITMIAEESVVLKLAQNMLGRECTRLDKGVVTTYKQMAQNIANAVLATVHPEKEFYIMGHRDVEEHIFERTFALNPPTVSILWKSEAGKLGLVIKKPMFEF